MIVLLLIAILAATVSQSARALVGGLLTLIFGVMLLILAGSII